MSTCRTQDFTTSSLHAAAADHHDHFVQVPLLTRARPATPQIAGIDPTKLEHPAPDRLVGDVEAAIRQEIFHVAVAEREAKIEPDRVLYDHWWEAVASVGDGLHQPTIADSGGDRP